MPPHNKGLPCPKRVPRAPASVAMMKKRLAWRTKSQGILFCSPSAYKHRCGEKGLNLCMGVGNGKVLFVKVLEKRLNGARWVECLGKQVAPKLKTLGKGAFLLRDGDPGSHETKKGRAEEFRLKVRAVKQPPYAPDLNSLDINHWHWIETEVLDEERAWERKHPGKDFKETFEEFGKRVVKWCRKLPRDLILATQESMHRRCKDLAENDGNWVKGD